MIILYYDCYYFEHEFEQNRIALRMCRGLSVPTIFMLENTTQCLGRSSSILQRYAHTKELRACFIVWYTVGHTHNYIQ